MTDSDLILNGECTRLWLDRWDAEPRPGYRLDDDGDAGCRTMSDYTVLALCAVTVAVAVAVPLPVAVQRLYSTYAVPVQRLCSGCTVAVQWLCIDRKLCFYHSITAQSVAVQVVGSRFVFGLTKQEVWACSPSSPAPI